MNLGKRANPNERIVVTGMGVVSPVGNSVSEAFDRSVKGQSGVRADLDFKRDDLATRFGAPVREFDPVRFMPAKEVRRFDRFVGFSAGATAEALAQASFAPGYVDPRRVGVVYASGIGGVEFIQAASEILVSSPKISPFSIPGSIINMAAGYLSILHGFKGPNFGVTSACASSAHAVISSAMILQSGLADVMVTGGAESCVNRIGLACFNACRALSTRNEDPQGASRPWDQGRDGFVMGEGAATLILETLAHAQKRGVQPIAELVGFGMSSDAFHITAPDETADGPARAITAALESGGIQAREIDYINAHGTSTPLGDLMEIQAVERALGRLDMPISSTKSMSGHLLGAAGGLEAILTIEALRHGVVPPTINLSNPDERLPKGLNLVANEAQSIRARVGLSNSFGFGGVNACLIFSTLD